MEYLYEVSLNDLKDLKHIEWFLSHCDDYQFTSTNAQELLESLLYKIKKKNIFYYDLINEYSELIKLFENNPFNYQYDVLEAKNKGLETENTNYYFIKIWDQERNCYIVPFQYILDNPIEHDIKQAKIRFDNKLLDNRKKVVENFEALQKHYLNYWQNGVCDAINRYKTVNNGASYHLIKTSIHFFIYNLLLFKIMHEAQFYNVVTHIWQLFSTNPGSIYSASQVYSGHIYLGIAALLLIGYFIYLDCYYIYGLYYLIFVKRKYDYVYKYHNKVLTLYEQFCKDWCQSKERSLPQQITKVKHRRSIYLPLIKKVSRKYNFYEIRIERAGKGKLRKKKGIINVNLPYNKFYQTPMKKQYLKLLLLLIFVEAICKTTMIIEYIR